MATGFLNIVLHAHLPYVRHPEHASFFEENWLFEAITECYIPLIGMLDRLQADHIDYRLTLSLSPTLLTMLRDPLLQSRYLSHLQQLLELAEKEIVRTKNQPEFQKLARLYRRFFLNTLDTYQSRYQGDLLTAFAKHQTSGKLELITTAATHGFLPLLSISETAVHSQINVGLQTFQEHFGFATNGFWLPECGYYPGLENLLKDAGLRYFFVDNHSLLNASQAPEQSVYAPLACENGVAAFARNPQASEQVWSSKQGYPGDGDYREYYRDIGYDLELDYIAPYILEGEIRSHTGIKYYRVTGDTPEKEIYQPKIARAKAKHHAQDFINKCRQQFETQSLTTDKPALIVAPYDAELFGHWWFEGPYWLEWVLRLAAEQNDIQTITGSSYLNYYPELQTATPSASTWGDQGYSSYWINESNDWLYPFLYKATSELENFVVELTGVSVNNLQKRALNQAFRSLLLAQSSDWPFIMKSGTSCNYANKRVTDHLARFNYLYESLRKGKIDERYLASLEYMDNIFPNIDFRKYRPNPHSG